MRLPSLPFARRRSVLGLDVGVDGVRLVAMDQRGGDLHVAWTEEVPLTELQGFVDYDMVLERIEEQVGERIRGRYEVATVPPWNSARVALEEFPAMDPARFHQAAHWYFQNNEREDMLEPVERGIPQPPRETVEGNSVVDGLMVSLDRVMLTGMADFCQRLQLRLQWLVPTSVCFPALLARSGHGDDRSLVIDIGAGQSRMTFAVGGTVRLVRKLKPGANDIVRALTEQLDLDWMTANHVLLAASGLGPLAVDDPDGVTARAQDILDRELDRLAEALLGEIQRSAAYVEARHGESVDRVLLSGGMGGAPGLLEKLQSGTDLAIAPFDPFEATKGDPGVEGPARTHFTLAAGAAALALANDPGTNLLLSERAPKPERERATRAATWTLPRIVGTAAAVAVVGGVVAFDQIQSRRIAGAIEEQELLRSEHLALRVRAQELTAQEDLFEIEGRIESIRDLYRSRHLFTPFFSRVVDSLPESLQLDGLLVETASSDEGDSDEKGAGHSVRLRGRTHDVDAVGRFVVALEDDDLLSRIEVLRIQQSESAENGFTFELRGRPVIDRQGEWIAANAIENGDGEVAR